jgi:hypothetical protein
MSEYTRCGVETDAPVTCSIPSIRGVSGDSLTKIPYFVPRAFCYRSLERPFDPSANELSIGK